MTERFIADNEYVMQNGQVYVVCGGEHSADVVATALNELINENKQLKKENKRLKYDLEHKQEHINQLTRKPLLTDILPQAHDILRINNELEEENEQLKKENKHLRCTIESNSQDDYINYLKKQNEQLKQELFEARKDYLIETADIIDKLYLEDEIEEERKEIFGDNNDQMKGMWND